MEEDTFMYDLTATIVHHGSGFVLFQIFVILSFHCVQGVCCCRSGSSGHYTAYAHCGDDWFHFNDSHVTLTDETRVANAKAYLLFYVQRSLR